MIKNKSIPKKFYQYYSFNKPEEYIESIFRNCALYFNSPNKFNDPFDCKSPMHYKGTRKQQIKWLKEQIKKRYSLLNFYTASNIEKLRATLLTKSYSWKYEKEWRIIEHESGPGWYHFPKELLTGIIFGSEMKKENSDLIIKWATKYGFQPVYYFVKQHKERYQLVIERM